MVYLALLRGINVGGKNKVDMKQLKVVFGQAGMENVATYINSGNVVFSHETLKPAAIVDSLETAIYKQFDLPIKLLLRDINDIQAVVEALPANWINDGVMKCDVMFLWETVDNTAVLDSMTIKPGIDAVKYVKGAVLWSVARKNITRSGLLKIVGTALYRQMTIRNCNTVRKLYEQMQTMASGDSL